MSTGLLVRQLESEAIEYLACADAFDEDANVVEAGIEERVLRVAVVDREWVRQTLVDVVGAKRDIAIQKRYLAAQKTKLALQWSLWLLSRGLGVTRDQTETRARIDRTTADRLVSG